MGDLTIDQQAEPIGMGKGRPLAGGFEFGESWAMPESSSWCS